MIYQINKIIRDTRIALGLNPEREPISDECHQLQVEDIIRAGVIEAVASVHMSARAEELDDGYAFGDAVYWDGDDTWGWVLLPDDFMRLIVFEMDDWRRAVYEAVNPNSTEYEVQRCGIWGLRGNASRPVCAIVERNEGRALEFYSCKSQLAQVRRARYLPYPVIDNTDGIYISTRCYHSVIQYLTNYFKNVTNYEDN